MLRKLVCLVALLGTNSLRAMEVAAVPLQAQNTASKKVLIFDLGGIFFDLRYVAMGLEAAGDGSKFWGAYALARHLLWNWNLSLDQKFFAALEQFPLKPEEGFKRTCTPKGRELPYALCAYQAGRISNEDFVKMANETLERISKESFFANQVEEQIIRNIFKFTFTPAIHAQYSYPLQDAIDMLEQVASLKNEDGSKKYMLLPLSNWDGDSFEIMRKNHEAFFAHFEKLFISAYLGTIKPNKAAYDAVINYVQAKGFAKSDCIFFDDQSENVNAAIAFGIDAELVKRSDVQSLREALVKRGILPA